MRIVQDQALELLTIKSAENDLPEKDHLESANDTSAPSDTSTTREKPDRKAQHGVTEFYFATRSSRHGSEESQQRNKEAVAAILNGPRLKIERNHHLSEDLEDD